MRFDTNPWLVSRGAVDWNRLVAKVPVHRFEQLHGLLVRPDGVDDNREQSEASEEEQALGESHKGIELTPMGERYPPHVVGEHHATVEHVDHHPLVGFPDPGVRPAGLEERETQQI